MQFAGEISPSIFRYTFQCFYKQFLCIFYLPEMQISLWDYCVNINHKQTRPKLWRKKCHIGSIFYWEVNILLQGSTSYLLVNILFSGLLSKNINKRPMGHIAHLRKQFKSINIYDYIITLIKRRKKNIIIFMRIKWFFFEQNWIPFTKGWFVPNLTEIGSVVLEKKIS